MLSAEGLSVGALNVLLKVVALAFVAVARESAKSTLSMLTSLRLLKRGRCPLTYHSDDRIFNLLGIAKRLAKLSTVAFFTIAVMSMLLIPAELLTDFGVRDSNKCKPKRELTIGICAIKANLRNSFSHELSSAMLTEDMPWDNTELSSNQIRQGLKKNLTGIEYFGNKEVERNSSLPVVISNCKVTGLRAHKALNVKLDMAKYTLMGRPGLGINAITIDSKKYSGSGLLTYNFAYYSAFLVHNPRKSESNTQVTVFEYSNSNILAKMAREKSNASEQLLPPGDVILSYRVACEKASMPNAQFTRAVFVYRSAQLGRSAKRKAMKQVELKVDGHTVKTPALLENGDVVKAVIASKIQEPVSCTGETFFYTRCGVLRIEYAIPLISLTISLLLICIILQIIVCSTHNSIKAPISDAAWTRFALNLTTTESIVCNEDPNLFSQHYARYGKHGICGEYVRKRGVLDWFFYVRMVSFSEPRDE